MLAWKKNLEYTVFLQSTDQALPCFLVAGQVVKGPAGLITSPAGK